MCDNKFLPVTQKAYFPKKSLSVPITMNSKFYTECKTYNTVDSKWERLYDQYEIDTNINI